jgi:tetratricopeptide (TPR) repeat protein
LPDRESEGWPDPGEATTEVTLADSASDSIAAQIAARIEASPNVPGDALDWASVAAGYVREADARAGDPASGATLLFEAGRIFEERLGSPADALPLHRRAFEKDPTFRPNLLAARRLATHLGDDSFVVDLLAAEERLEEDPTVRADLTAFRVRWLLGLDRIAEANAALKAAEEASPHTFTIAEAKASAAAASRDARTLAAAWTECGETTSDASLAPHFQGAAATVMEDALGERDRAAELYLAAFARRPEDRFLRAAARRHAECSGEWEQLASLLRAEAEETSGREAAAAWSAAAWVEQSRLGRLPAATECLQRGAQAAPQSPEILRALARAQEAAAELAGEAEALSQLAELFANRGAPAERKEAVDVLLRLATLEEMRGRLPQAVQACRDALALVPAERPILSMLGRLCARTGDFEGVANAYLAEAEVAGDLADRSRLLLRAAEVLEGRLSRPDDALAKYREALAADPSLAPARDALERLHTRAGEWREVVAILETDLGQLHAPREQVAQLFRIAQILEERLADPDGAAGTWRRLLALDPDHLVALRALSRCLEAGGHHAELAEALLREGTVVEDPRRRASLHARRAEILEERLSDPERARDEWELVLAIDPHHVPAQRALGRLHARADRGGDLISLLRREADAAPTPGAAAAILLRAGALAARQPGGDEQAIVLYREALTLAPDNISALESLAGIYRRRGDAESLIEILRARAASTEVPEVKAASLIEAARLYEEKLGDAQQAVAAYEEGLAADPGQLAARGALDRIHACAGNRAALRALRAGPSTGASAEQLAHRVAMELGEGGDAAAAREAAQALGTLRAGGAPAILALAGDLPKHARARLRTALSERAVIADDIAVLLMGAAAEQEPGAARDAILARAAAIAPERRPLVPHAEDVLRQADHEAMAARFQQNGARESTPAYRAHWFVRAGEAWERTGNDDAALTAYRGALAVAPTYLPALGAARALFARLGDWAALRGTLQAEGSARRDPAGSAAAWLKAGEIAEEHFGDVDAAARDFRTAAERDPSDPTPMLRLEAVVAGQSSYELLELKRSRAASESDPARAPAAWLDVARLASLMGGEPSDVLASLDRALSFDPGFAPALALRARVLGDEGRVSEALNDYEACVLRTPEDAARLPLHLAAAALLQETGGDAARTQGHLQAALALSPENAEALGRLARLYFDLQDLPAAADALRRLADLPALSSEARAEHLLGLAPVEAARGDLGAAADACRRALEAHPGDPRALRLLAEFEERRENHAGLAAALEAAAETAPDHGARLQARISLARVCAERLNDPVRAIGHLSAALAASPDRDDARAMMAALLEAQGSALAIQEHLTLIRRTPARVDSWSALYRIHAAAGARDRAFVAAGILSWLGAPLPDANAAALLEAGAQRGLASVPVLAESDWELLRHPLERGPFADVLSAAGPAIAATLCPPVGQPEETIEARHPLRELVRELATAIGIDAYDVHPGPPGRVTTFGGELPVVVVGVDLTRRATPLEARFLLGRALARIRLHAHLADTLRSDELGAAVAAAVRLVVPGYAGTGQPTEEAVRRLGRAISRRARRALEAPARALATMQPPPDPGQWHGLAGLTADRAGAALCGDVPTALSLLVNEGALGGASIPPGERAAAALERPDVAALLSFAATEEHFLLRKRLNVALA